MKEDFGLNSKPCSVNDLNPGCVEMWTLGQQVAVRRLCVKTRAEYKQPARYELLKDFSTRAARIAGNYARIYLEQERNGQPEQKGRFYWTGLAAFASKQVMCALDYSSTSKWHYATPAAIAAFEMTKQYLGKGNFWLFQDIFVWHWFYINYPQQFNERITNRDLDACYPALKQNFAELPWFDDALPRIKNLKVTDHLREGFEWISRIEKTPEGSIREQHKFRSLMAIARHEQLKILQPLLYDSTLFRTLLDSQALLEGHLGVPRRLVAFSTQCETGDPQTEVVMTEGDLYDPTDRMKFITTIAVTYHNVMIKRPAQMEQIISTIATWSERVD